VPKPRTPSPAWALLLLPVALLAAWWAFGRPHAGGTGTPAAESASYLAEPAPLVARATSTPPAGAETTGSLPVPDTLATEPDSASAAAPPPPPLGRDEVVADDPTISSWTTYEAALAESRVNGKPILLAFTADWSETSEQLNVHVFDDVAAGITVRSAVIPVALVDRRQEDGRNNATFVQLQQRFHVERFPTVVVLHPETGRVARKVGYPGAAEMLGWIIEAASPSE
jgi:hypothetical protein